MGKLIVAKSNRGTPDPIGLHDSEGNIINPATIEKLEELKIALQNIYNAVDDLELTTENIKIEAGEINLNTDDLEAKVQSIKDQLDVLLSTRASESTLQALLNALGEGSGTNILTEVQNILAKINVDLSTRASEDTLVEIKNYLDTVETKLQSIINKLDVALSTRASENTLQEVRDTIGQESGVTVLSRLKDIWDKLVELFNNGIARIKLWDGEHTANITADGKLEVSIGASLTNTTLQILFDKAHSAVNTGEWQEVLNYTIPEGYNLNVIAFEGQSQTANEAIRAVYKNIMGSFNCSTDTFTDGSSMSLPRYMTRLYILVTTAIGSGSNDTFIITYINSDGVSGRTATVTVTKSSLVGTRLEIPLQTGDKGIIDITNITHSATGQAGEVQVAGYIELLYLTLSTANTQYQTASIPLSSLVVLEGENIYLQYLSSTKTSYIRRLNLLVTLVPKIT